MKRIIGLILVLLLFAGCNRQPAQEETLLPETTQAVQMEATLQTEPAVPDTEPPETVPETQAPTEPPAPESDAVFVRVLDYIPTACQELKYATEDNFTGQVIYSFEDAYLRYGTVKKLQNVSRDLAELGLYIKIWDGFRPVSAQFALWKICPDPTYVANPNKGYSSHSRGNTIDLTLVDENGVEVEMPTGFDDFSPKADRNYYDCTETAANNSQLLEILMEKHGFTGYAGEWWHYSDTTSYPVENVFEPEK